MRIVLMGISIIMLIVSVQAWRRTGGRRMMWVMLSFLCFVLLSGMIMLGAIWDDPAWSAPNGMVMVLALIIGANYLALLKG